MAEVFLFYSSLFVQLQLDFPFLLAEFVIGRMGQADAVTSLKRLAPGKKWPLVGWMGLAVSFIILSFYSVVGGWILSYLARAIFFQLDATDHGDLFNTIIANPMEVLLAQAVFMALTIWIVQSGIRGGIERASRWMMPLLFIFFIILAIRSLTLDGAMEGVRFLFVPDWSLLNRFDVFTCTWSSFLLLECRGDCNDDLCFLFTERRKVRTIGNECFDFEYYYFNFGWSCHFPSSVRTRTITC